MLAFMGLGPIEILLVFLVVLLFFGGRKIPEIARGLGKGLREFKKARDDLDHSLDEDEQDSSQQKPPDDRGKNGAA